MTNEYRVVKFGNPVILKREAGSPPPCAGFDIDLVDKHKKVHQAILVEVNFLEGKGYSCIWTIKGPGNNETVFHQAQAEIQAAEDAKMFAILDDIAKNGLDEIAKPKPKKKKAKKKSRSKPIAKAKVKALSEKAAVKKKQPKKKAAAKKKTPKDMGAVLKSLQKHLMSGTKGEFHPGMWGGDAFEDFGKAVEKAAKATAELKPALTKLKVTK